LGFEPTISARERPQIRNLDRAATETGYDRKYQVQIPAAFDFVHRISSKEGVEMKTIMIVIIIIIIIIIINCNWVVTRWQWLFYMYTKY